MRTTRSRGWLMLAALAIVVSSLTLLTAAAWARPWLGVYTQEITGELRDGLDLHGGDGVLINRVVDGSPADRAGLRKGDVITRFNSRGVGSPDDLARLVGDSRDDQEVELSVLRDGRTRSFDVRLGERPSDDEDMTPAPPAPPGAPEAPEAPAPPRMKHDMKIKIAPPGDDDNDNDNDGHVHVYRWNGGDDGNGAPQVFKWDGNGDMAPMLKGLGNLRMLGMSRGRLGVRIESLNEDLASALGTPDKDGVLILGVNKDTPAEKAGLRAGDVILSVNDRRVANSEELVKAIGDADSKVSLNVWRKGSHRTVEAELEGSRTMRREMSMDDDRPAPRREVLHSRDGERSGDDDLKQQLDDLKQQLRDLKQQLEDQKRNN